MKFTEQVNLQYQKEGTSESPQSKQFKHKFIWMQKKIKLKSVHHFLVIHICHELFEEPVRDLPKAGQF